MNNKIKIVYRKVSELIPAEYNPRKTNYKQEAKIEASLKRFGFADPVIININPERKNIIVGGNQRTRIAKDKLGYTEVPCVEMNLTRDQEKELNIRLNKNTGEFDVDLLGEYFTSEELGGWGFDDLELEDIEFNGYDGDGIGDSDGEIEEDEVPEVEEEARAKLGDLFILGEHRLLCGDATSEEDVKKLMDGEKADMVFTDPPYNIGYKGTMSNTTKNGVEIPHVAISAKYDAIKNDSMDKESFLKFIDQSLNILIKNTKGAWYICFGSQTLDELLLPLVKNKMKWKSIIIWMKNQSTISGKDYKSRYEPIVYGDFGSNFQAERFNQEDIWEFQRTLKNDLHPTMKPIPLICQAINNSSIKNDIVLDLFGGSGSTLIACDQTSRKCRMMELDPHYIDVIIKRYCNLTNTDPEEIFKQNEVQNEKV